MISKLIPYVSKVNDNKNFMTSGLLLEELNVKDFDKTRVFLYQKKMFNNNSIRFQMSKTLRSQKRVR